MFWNYVLLIVGIVVFIGGLFKLGQGQGGWSFDNVKANAGIGSGQASPATARQRSGDHAGKEGARLGRDRRDRDRFDCRTDRAV